MVANQSIAELKLQLKIVRVQRDREVLLMIIKNPVVEIVAGYLAIETLQKARIIPGVAGSLAEGGILGAVLCQQLGPVLPQLVSAGSEGLAALMKAVPALVGALAVGATV
jgi:hypothetical protein